MANRTMYFGTREKMRYIPCPQSGFDTSEKGWNERDDYLNGGAFTRKSFATHKEYNFDYNPTHSRDAIRVITDYSSGLYGKGPFYFHSPEALDKNVLPQFWASPMLGGLDAPILLGDAAPTVVDTPDNDLNYPIKSAQYDYTQTDGQKLWLPIPPGYTAWVGAHGVTDGFGGVRVTPYTTPILPGAAIAIALRDVGDNIRVDTGFNSSEYAGIEIDISLLGNRAEITGDFDGDYIYPSDGIFPGTDLYPAGGGWTPPNTRATYAQIAGIMVQILKTGKIPDRGDFVSGQGHSGCSFESHPSLNITAAYLQRGAGLVSSSFRLVETEGWR